MGTMAIMLSSQTEYRASKQALIGCTLLALSLVLGNTTCLKAESQPGQSGPVWAQEKKPSFFSRLFRRNSNPSRQQGHLPQHTSQNAGGHHQHAHYEQAANDETGGNISPSMVVTTGGIQPVTRTPLVLAPQQKSQTTPQQPTQASPQTQHRQQVQAQLRKLYEQNGQQMPEGFSSTPTSNQAVQPAAVTPQPVQQQPVPQQSVVQQHPVTPQPAAVQQQAAQQQPETPIQIQQQPTAVAEQSTPAQTQSPAVTRHNQYTQQFAQQKYERSQQPEPKRKNLFQKLFRLGRSDQEDQQPASLAEQPVPYQVPAAPQPLQIQQLQPQAPMVAGPAPTPQPVGTPNYYPVSPTVAPKVNSVSSASQVVQANVTAPSRPLAPVAQTTPQPNTQRIIAVPKAPAPALFEPSDRVQVVSMFKTVNEPNVEATVQPAAETTTAAKPETKADTPFTGLTLDEKPTGMIKNAEMADVKSQPVAVQAEAVPVPVQAEQEKPAATEIKSVVAKPEQTVVPVQQETAQPQPIMSKSTQPKSDKAPLVTEQSETEKKWTADSTTPDGDAPSSDLVSKEEIETTEEIETADARQPAQVSAQLTQQAKPARTSIQAPVPQPAIITVENKSEELLAKVKSRSNVPGFKGFCPVNLRDQRTLTDAKVAYCSTYKSVTYHFSAAEAKICFDQAPERYAPVAGGTDVVRLRDGNDLAAGSLEHAVWYKGRLYMFSGEESTNTFLSDPETYAKQ